MQAFQNPTDLTDVGLRVKISALGENKPGVHLEIRIDPRIFCCASRAANIRARYIA